MYLYRVSEGDSETETARQGEYTGTRTGTDGHANMGIHTNVNAGEKGQNLIAHTHNFYLCND